jgi:hypothetical protein
MISIDFSQDNNAKEVRKIAFAENTDKQSRDSDSFINHRQTKTSTKFKNLVKTKKNAKFKLEYSINYDYQVIQ